MYPDEFAECDGSVEIMPGMYAGQQSRKTFGLAYRTILGNDTDLNDYGYKLHLVYGCLQHLLKRVTAQSTTVLRRLLCPGRSAPHRSLSTSWSTVRS